MKKNTSIIILIAICFIILIPSIVLLKASSWYGDEYQQAWNYTNGGLDALWSRFLEWSPRPLSDSILYIYYGIVERTKEPLIGTFLGILWLFFGSSLYIGIRNIIKSNTDYLKLDKNNFKFFSQDKEDKKKSNLFLDSELICLLLTLFLFIYFFFIEKPTEIFYWPAGAAPYLLSASGVILGLSTLIKVSTDSYVSYLQTTSLVIFAIITAFSSEVGALYQLIVSLFLLSILILSRVKKYNPLNRSVFIWNKQSTIKLFIAASTSLLLSSIILFSLKNSRVGKAELNSLSSPITGNIKSSLILAVKDFLKETFLLNNISLKIDSFTTSFSYSLVCNLGLLLLVILLTIRAKVCLRKSTELICLILILPLITTNFITITASAYQFGEICCDRHLHFRAILTGLSIFLLGLVIASWLYKHLTTADAKVFVDKSSLKSFLLTSNFSVVIITTVSLILLVNLQINAISNDLRNFQLITNCNKKNWINNISNQSRYGEYFNPPRTKYVTSLYIPEKPGIYLLSQNNLHYNTEHYMRYFNKEELSLYPNNLINHEQ